MLIGSGPLIVEQGSDYGMAADANELVDFSAPEIRDSSSLPLTIDRISMIEPKSMKVRVEVQEILLGLPNRPFEGGVLTGKPSPKIEGPYELAAGAIVQPDQGNDQGYVVVIVVKESGTGVAWFNGLEIDYHIGSQGYVAKAQLEMKICSPAMKYKSTPGSCASAPAS